MEAPISKTRWIGMKEQLSAGVAQLESAGIGDLLLAIVLSNEASVGAAFAEICESARVISVMDATAEPIRRQQLAKRTRIDSTNLNKVTGPLTRAGWLKASADAEGVTYRRSSLVDVLLMGKTVAEWRRANARRLGP